MILKFSCLQTKFHKARAAAHILKASCIGNDKILLGLKSYNLELKRVALTSVPISFYNFFNQKKQISRKQIFFSHWESFNEFYGINFDTINSDSGDEYPPTRRCLSTIKLYKNIFHAAMSLVVKSIFIFICW